MRKFIVIIGYAVLAVLFMFLASCTAEMNEITETSSSSESTVATTVTKSGSVYELNDVIPEYYHFLPQMADSTSILCKAVKYAKENWKQVDFYNVTYSSSDTSLPKLSGRVYARKDYADSKSFKGIILYSHSSMAANSESPSVTDNYMMALFATAGYVVVCPDYLGFGASQHYPQYFMNRESTALQAIDMLKQVRSWFSTNGVTVGDKLYNIGYAEGGNAALAIERLAEEQYSSEIQFTKTYSGAGAYDIDATYRNMVSTNEMTSPSLLSFIITGIDNANNMNLDYTQIFKGQLLSQYTDLLYSKNYTMDQITAKIGSTKFTDVYSSEMADTTSTLSLKLRQEMKNNSLVSGWKYTGTPIMLFHSTEDTVIPSLNTTEMADKLNNDGYTNSNLQVINKSMGNHGTAGLYFNFIALLDIAGVNYTVE